MKQQSNKNNLDAPWLDELRQEMSDCTDFGTTLPADGWDKIAAKVNGPAIAPQPEKSRRKPLIIWLSAAASFLLLIGLGTTYLLTMDNGQQTTDNGLQTTDNRQLTTDGSNTQAVIGQVEQASPEATPAKPADIVMPVKTPVQQKLLAVTPKNTPKPTEEAAPVSPASTIEQVIEPNENLAPTEKPAPTEEEVQQIIESYKSQLKQAENEVLLAMNEPETASSRDLSWHLGMALDGSGSFYDEIGAEPEPTYKTAHYESITTQRLTRATDGQYLKPATKHSLPTDVLDSDHHRALSFGITLSRDLNQRLALQSGLVATTLLSDVTLYNKSRVGQRVQYLGIPLQLNVSLFQTTHWQIYASAGGRMDQALKCKRANLDIDYKKQQWSVSTAAGIQFMFTRRIGLYAEPHLSYFFDNGSGEEVPTLFSERPLCFNLQAGLKIRL